MPSLQQTPKKGQAVPPAALIDGVSQQQIDAAVKAHVRKGASIELAQSRQGLEAAHAKLAELEAKYSDAIDQISLCRDNLEQDAALFQVIYMQLTKTAELAQQFAPLLNRVISLAGLGEREASAWQECATRFLREAGEVAA